MLEGLLVAPAPDGATQLHIIGLIVCALVLYLSVAEGLRQVWRVSQPIAAVLVVVPFVKLLFGLYYIFGDSEVIVRLLNADVSLDTPWTYFVVGGTRQVFFTYRDLAFLFTSMMVFPMLVVGAYATNAVAAMFGAVRGVSFVVRQQPCPKCGRKIAVNATYCHHCGVVFAEMLPDDPERDEEMRRQREEQRRDQRPR